MTVSKKVVGKKFSLPKRAEMKWVACMKGCGNELEIDSDSLAGTCWRCVQRMVGPPEVLVRAKKAAEADENKIRRPRGWRFYKEFVDVEGNVFFRGVEQSKLKGKKKPTVIEPKVKKTGFEKEQERIAKQKKLAEKYEKKQAKLNGKKKKRGKK